MIQKLEIYAKPEGSSVWLDAAQGENNARSYDITIIGLDSRPIDLTGCMVAMYVIKGKNTVQIPVKTEGSTAHVTLPAGACDTPGDHPCWIQVIKPEVYDLRVDHLILRVQACEIDGAGKASSEFGVLTQLIFDAQEAVGHADTATGQAVKAAEAASTAAESANTAAKRASAVATDAEETVQSAHAATAAATEAAQEAQTKADYAQSQSNAAKAIVDQWQGLDVSNLVPDTRTINAKPLSANITLSPADVGAQQQTAARNSMVKADASGNLVAVTVYKLDTLFVSVTPRTEKGVINLSGSLSNYNLIAIVTAPTSNGYISHHTNLYFPATFGLTTAQNIWGVDINTNTLKKGDIRFGYNGSTNDPQKVYLASTPSNCGIYGIYGLGFGA